MSCLRGSPGRTGSQDEGGGILDWIRRELTGKQRVRSTSSHDIGGRDAYEGGGDGESGTGGEYGAFCGGGIGVVEGCVEGVTGRGREIMRRTLHLATR